MHDSSVLNQGNQIFNPNREITESSYFAQFFTSHLKIYIHGDPYCLSLFVLENKILQTGQSINNRN
jgi:hypothetical protein